MNTQDSEKQLNVLEKEQAKLPVMMFPLTKDQKKIETAYTNNLAAVFSILKENKFAPAKGVPASEMDGLIDEFFQEEIESKKEEVKSKLKTLLQSKVNFDKVIAEETRKFQSIIMNKKKEFNTELESVVSLIQGIDNMKNDFLKSLNQDVVETSEE